MVAGDVVGRRESARARERSQKELERRRRERQERVCETEEVRKEGKKERNKKARIRFWSNQIKSTPIPFPSR